MRKRPTSFTSARGIDAGDVSKNAIFLCVSSSCVLLWHRNLFTVAIKARLGVWQVFRFKEYLKRAGKKLYATICNIPWPQKSRRHLKITYCVSVSHSQFLHIDTILKLMVWPRETAVETHKFEVFFHVQTSQGSRIRTSLQYWEKQRSPQENIQDETSVVKNDMTS